MTNLELFKQALAEGVSRHFDRMVNMVYRLKYGNTNNYFIFGEKANLLIDTDYPGTLPLLYKALKEEGIRASDLDYVIATHYHPDHIALIGELVGQGVKLIIIENQLEYVHFSDSIFEKDKRLHYSPIYTKDAVILKPEESRAFLSSIGIDGEIIITNSHSEDSISIVLDNNHCFVGDLEPMEYIDGYDDNAKLKADWENILRFYPHHIHYSHHHE